MKGPRVFAAPLARTRHTRCKGSSMTDQTIDADERPVNSTHARSRKEAKELGRTRFFTGVPCKRGHVAERVVSNGACIECQRLHAAAYSARYRAARPEKVKEAQAAWRERNPEYFRAWRAANRARNQAVQNAWRAANPEKSRALVLNYQSRKRKAPGRHTAADIERIREEQRGMCRVCSADLSATGYHIDHMTPLARGGSNWPENLCLLCPSCNCRKRDQTLDEFMAAGGFERVA